MTSVRAAGSGSPRSSSDTPLRQQGELLLGDVTRAAGFLRQFVVYGHQQISNLEPVSVPRVLRDMAPVLKRVLGDDITLVLPKTTDRFEVDVDAERVERILVNVANYARERMPHGGRVRIQLATDGRRPRVPGQPPQGPPGAHVLITITEMQGAVWPALPIQLPIGRSAHGRRHRVSVRQARHGPGPSRGPHRRFGRALVDVGGARREHDAADPPSEANPGRVVEPAAPASWSDRGRQLARWFRH